MNNSKNILGLTYAAVLCIIIGAILILAMLTCCTPSRNIPKPSVQDSMEVGWEVEGNYIIVQRIDNGSWANIWESTNKKDTVELPFKGNLYRLKVYLDQDSSFSKTIYVK